MQRRAQISGNTIVNIAVFDEENLPEWATSWPVLPDHVGFGWAWQDGEFLPPADDLEAVETA